MNIETFKHRKKLIDEQHKSELENLTKQYIKENDFGNVERVKDGKGEIIVDSVRIEMDSNDIPICVYSGEAINRKTGLPHVRHSKKREIRQTDIK